MAGLVADIANLGALRAVPGQVTPLVAVVACLTGSAAAVWAAAGYVPRLVAVVA